MDEAWRKLSLQLSTCAGEAARHLRGFESAVEHEGLESPAAAAWAQKATSATRSWLELVDQAHAMSASRRGLPPEPGA